jgi:hypothetical protein
MAQLGMLPPGTRFRVRSKRLNLTGTLIKANQCRARVKVDGASAQRIVFTDKHGDEHDFVATNSPERNWSPGTEVDILELGQPAESVEPEPEQEKEWFED